MSFRVDGTDWDEIGASRSGLVAAGGAAPKLAARAGRLPVVRHGLRYPPALPTPVTTMGRCRGSIAATPKKHSTASSTRPRKLQNWTTGRLGMAVVLLVAGCADREWTQSSACFEPTARPAGLVLAGSGANLAPMRLVALEYAVRYPDRKVQVEQSIGTSGAMRALADGEIDVGLASRRLRDEELDDGLDEHPFARVAVAAIVNERQGVSSMTSEHLMKIYDGRSVAWPDGTPIVPIVRQAGDSTTKVIERSAPHLALSLQRARISRRALVRYTDQEMRDALLSIEGAIGMLDAGTVRLEGLPLRPLTLDGAAPTARAVRDGVYPFSLRLSLVTRQETTERELHFLAFARSDSVQSALEAAGYVMPDTEESP